MCDKSGSSHLSQLVSTGFPFAPTAFVMVVKVLQLLRDNVWSDGVPNPQVADFLCPFTGNVMVDPVKAEDGHTYEREKIQKWLETNTTSPQTRQPMGKKLVANELLREAIEKYEAVRRGEPHPVEVYQDGETIQAADHSSSKTVKIRWPTGGHIPPGMKKNRVLVIEPGAAPDEPNSKRRRLDPQMLQDGAGYSSMAEALSKFFRELDPLRDLLQEVLEGWAPPRIVVIGDESAGKSTILEQLANMPIFPRNLRFCTRLPIHLRLRRDPGVSKAQLSIYKIEQDGSELKEGRVLCSVFAIGCKRVLGSLQTLFAFP